MANLRSINPDAYDKLNALQTGMRQAEVDRALAVRVLKTTATRHAVATIKARDQHKRRPRVTLV